MMKTTLFALALSLIGPPPQPGHRLVPRIQPGQQIVAIGDSITQTGGYLRDVDAVFARQYAKLKLPRIINAGIGGQKAEDMVARFEKDVVSRKPAFVLISVGINDVWHRLDKPADEQVLASYRKNVDEMVRMAQDAGIKVILLSPTIIEENPASEGNTRLEKYIQAEKEIARQRECEFIDLHALFLRALAKMAETQPAGATTRPANRLTTDGVHMKPLGDAIIAIGVLRAFGVPDKRIAATDVNLLLK